MFGDTSFLCSKFCLRKYIHIYMCVYIYIYIGACICIYIYIYIYIYNKNKIMIQLRHLLLVFCDFRPFWQTFGDISGRSGCQAHLQGFWKAFGVASSQPCYQATFWRASNDIQNHWCSHVLYSSTKHQHLSSCNKHQIKRKLDLCPSGPPTVA